MFSRSLNERPPVYYLFLFFVAYVAGGGLAQGLKLIPGVDVTFWPPAGIFTAVLLLTRKLSWPWWVFAGCLAELACNALWFHSAIPLALIYFLANAFVATTAAALIKWFTEAPFRFESAREILTFVVFGAGVAPLISATIIATTDSLLGKHAFWTAWPLVWLGDSSGLLVSGPLTLMAVDVWRERQKISRAQWMEAGALCAGIILLGVLSFREILPTPYEMLPPLLWAAARFQLRGAALGLALIAIMEAYFTSSGAAPLAVESEVLRQKIIGLQVFLAVAALSSLIVAVLSQQHKQALLSLQDANTQLETRIAERTARIAEQQRFIENVIDTAPNTIYIFDIKEKKRIYSSRSDDDLGYDKDQVAAAGFSFLSSVTHPDDAAKVPELFNRWATAGESEVLEAEYRLRHKDGHWVWRSSHEKVFMRDDKGHVRQIIGISYDITARKLAEEALRENEAKLRLALDAGQTATWSWDVVRNISTWDERYKQQHGFTDTKDLSFVGWMARVHPDDQQALENRLNTILLSPAEDNWNMEFRIVHPDLGERWMWGLGKAKRNSAGKVISMAGINMDITQRKRSEHHQTLLMNELNHRVKNTLATVQSMASQTLRSSPDLAEAKSRFEGRLMSLSKAHDVLTREKWESAPLTDIVERAIAPYQGSKHNRFAVNGPDVRLSSQMALAFAMTIHELCTNAVKYGALTTESGTVKIAWTISRASSSTSKLIFKWVERGGPPVKAPSSRGFGTKLIERSLSSDLGGNVHIDFEKSGVSCVIETTVQHASA